MSIYLTVPRHSQGLTSILTTPHRCAHRPASQVSLDPLGADDYQQPLHSLGV